MALPSVADEWPSPVRWAAAVAAGLAWVLFGFGLNRLETHPVWFLVAAIVFVAPVLAFLGRGWLDEGAIVAIAVLSSMVASQGLAPAKVDQLHVLAWAVFRAWIPVLVVSAGLYVARRRFFNP